MMTAVYFNSILALTVQALAQQRTYIHVPTKMTWEDARKYCRAKHTDLAVFENESQINADLCSSDCWIGLHTDKTNAFSWIWANGEEVNLIDWKLATAMTEQCALLLRGSLFLTSCVGKLEVLCSEDDEISVKDPKTWEEALDYCRTLQTDPHSNGTSFSHRYDLSYMDTKIDNLYDKQKRIQDAQTEEVWIGLRFLAGQWFWVNGFPLETQPSACPAPRMHCGMKSKTGGLSARDCSEKRSFKCKLKKDGVSRLTVSAA